MRLEAILALIMMAVAVIFAILTLELKDLVYMVFSFAVMSVAIGSYYFLLNAIYLGIFQMLIYAGAVVAMAIAAIILTRGREEYDARRLNRSGNRAIHSSPIMRLQRCS